MSYLKFLNSLFFITLFVSYSFGHITEVDSLINANYTYLTTDSVQISLVYDLDYMYHLINLEKTEVIDLEKQVSFI